MKLNAVFQKNHNHNKSAITEVSAEYMSEQESIKKDTITKQLIQEESDEDEAGNDLIKDEYD